MSDPKELKPFNVNILIDTNIFFDDFFLEGKRFLALQNMLQKTTSSIIMPSVIIKEIKKKYKESLDQQQEKIAFINERFPGMVTQNKTVEEWLEEYETFWERQIKKMDMTIVDSSKVDLARLIERSLDERRPFGKKSKGFRDALIWESALMYLRKRATKDDYPIVVITKNKEDFGTDCLYDDLCEDLEGRRSFCYSDLSLFLDEHSGRIEFITDELVDKYIEDNYFEIEEIVDSVDDRDLLRRNTSHDFIEDLTVEQGPIPTGYWGVTSCYIYKEDKDYYYIQVELEAEVEYVVGSYRETNCYEALIDDYITLDRVHDVENATSIVDGVITCRVNKCSHEIETCTE